MKARVVWLGISAVALVAAYLVHSRAPWAINLLLPAAGWCALKGMT